MSRRGLPDIGAAPAASPLMVAWVLVGRRALVVGGGRLAAQRAAALISAGAHVRVVAHEPCAELRGRARRGELELEARGRGGLALDAGDLEGVALVCSAVSEPALARRVAELARACGVPVNTADVPELCDVHFPALHRDGPLQIAVATGGLGPGLASRIRDRLARALPAGAGRAVERFAELRRAVREVDPAPEAGPRRMAWLARAARELTLDALATLSERGVEALRERYIREATVPAAAGAGAAAPHVQPGRALLVGSGPGDPRLLTLAAREAIERADLVIADRLVPDAIVELARGEIRIARKTAGRAAEAQAEIGAWMIEALRAGRNVVRLKCGDPGLFGRAGEELEALARAGLGAELVSGVTSALAAPLAAGIPTTLRGVADRVLVLTGQGAGGSAPELPRYDPSTTYVWLMGVARLRALTGALIAAGFPSDLPAACVASATRPEQRVVSASLETLAERVEAEEIGPPAVILVGRVVAWGAERASEAALTRAG